jgi:hypothetical protein
LEAGPHPAEEAQEPFDERPATAPIRSEHLDAPMVSLAFGPAPPWPACWPLAVAASSERLVRRTGGVADHRWRRSCAAP